MTTLRWLSTALENLKAICNYYVEQGVPEQSRRTAISIVRTIDQLRSLPDMGRPGRVNGTRELVIARLPFVVIYRHKQGTVEILRILHTAQKWPR